MPAEDTRNVQDEFKGLPHDKIIEVLNARGNSLEIAIENTIRDYNLGTIVRTANALGIRTVHLIGRHQWNKRGAMMTDKYVTITYHDTAADFAVAVQGYRVYAIENNVPNTQSLHKTVFEPRAVLLFGQEGSGLSPQLLVIADYIVRIDQLGSTRSINVGVAAGIAMYEWSRQQALY